MKFMSLMAGAMLFLAPSLYAQDVRKLQPFDEIQVTGDIEVRLEKGDQEGATVQATGISEDKISVFVKNGKLKLQLLDGYFYRDVDVNIVVTYKTLRTVQAAGGARISSDAVMEGEFFAAKASSGAQVSLEVKVTNLNAMASEGGELRLSGTTASQEASASTGGKYEALDLQCERTQVRASMGGRAMVVAAKSLDASVNMGGQIDYSGDPEERNTRNVLAGEIRKI